MFKILKTSVRDTIIYSIGTFATKLSGFILVPLYTNTALLSERDYGVLNLAEATIQVVVSMFGMGLCYGYERWYHDKDYVDKRKSLFFSILVFTSLIGIVVVSLSMTLSKPLSAVLFNSPVYVSIFQLMIFCGVLEMIAQTPNSLIRLDERPMLFTAANLIKLIVTVVSTVIFVAYFKVGLKGVYYAQIIGLLGYFLVLSSFLLRHIQFKFEWQGLLDIIRFRFPFLLPVLALNLFNFNDRFIFANALGLEEAGIYSLGAKLANTIKVFLLTAIWLALTPIIYKMMNEPGHKRFYSKVMTYLSFAVLLVGLAFSFFSKELVSLLAEDESYLRAYQVIPIISLAIFFGMLKDTSLIGLNVSKKTSSIAIITIVVSLLNVGLNLIAIPMIGMIGAATANVITQLIFFVLVHRVAQKHYPIPYELRKIFLMMMVAIFLVIGELYMPKISFWLDSFLKLIMLASFPLILYFFNFYEPVELERINGFWKKWRNPKRWLENFRTLEF